jgi:gamma-glutamyltranspeptidase/glutathione hydrolase
VAPAVALARGFTPTRRLIDASARVGPKLPAGEPMRRWLYPDGHPLTASSRVVRTALAETIARFGRQGRDAIYRGPVAADLIATIKAHEGIITADELAAYEPIWRDPLVGSFRGRTIYTIAPPGGGATALEALNFLDALPALPKGSIGSSRYLHRIAEALTNAFADRARWMGDPKFFDVPIQRLASPEYGKSLAAHFSEDKVRPIEDYGTPAEKGSPIEPAHDHGTTHVCVVDGEGNAVALTTTVNLELGVQFEAPLSGIVLNDQMEDFSTFPGKPNAFGLVGGEANSIAAGKRPLSSMSPTLVVQDGNVVMCAGGSGGPTIPSSTVQAIVAVIDEGQDAEGAVSTPRVYAQWKPDTIVIEQDTPTDVADGLVKRGHKLRRLEHGAPAAQVIVVHDGIIEAASDPRKGGVPAAP